MLKDLGSGRYIDITSYRQWLGQNIFCIFVSIDGAVSFVLYFQLRGALECLVIIASLYFHSTLHAYQHMAYE